MWLKKKAGSKDNTQGKKRGRKCVILFFHKAAKLQANDCVFLQSYILEEQRTNAVQTYEKRALLTYSMFTDRPAHIKQEMEYILDMDSIDKQSF